MVIPAFIFLSAKPKAEVRASYHKAANPQALREPAENAVFGHAMPTHLVTDEAAIPR
jgi:hypothetical protein